MSGMFWSGARAGLSFAPGVFVLSASFGAVAQPVMGLVAPILMSVLQYAGSSQLAATAVLAADGSAAAAIAAGVMLNARFLPMSVVAAPALRGSKLRRSIEAQTIVDTSVAACLLGGALALALTPVLPPGLPVLLASAGALIGLKR